MSRIFISYRRSDSASVAGRIYDRLCARYQRHNVFKDVDAMPAGVNFHAYIEAALRQCDVVLILIGRDWLGARTPPERPRIEDPDDWVRIEVELALASQRPVLPLLVEGAHMPSAADLLDALHLLLAINALHVRNDPDFSHDMEHVYDAIDRAAATPFAAPIADPAPVTPRPTPDLAPVTPRPLAPPIPDRTPMQAPPSQPPALPTQATVTPRTIPVTSPPSPGVAPGPAPLPIPAQAAPALDMNPVFLPPPSVFAPRKPSAPSRSGTARLRSPVLVAVAAALVVVVIAGGWAAIATLTNFHPPRAPGSFVEYKVPPLAPDNNTSVQLGDITGGPDGALWFTYHTTIYDSVSKSTTPLTSAIWRITPNGSLKEFTLPDKWDDPVGIASGPDGNLWFTTIGLSSDANTIGRITPAGAISEYPLGGNDDQPGEIIAGPDGALWFTVANAHKIGRITTSGTITEFPLPVGSGHSNYPNAIASGPDGALWFTTEGDEAVGRITPAGMVTFFRTETSFSTSDSPTYPDSITVGPDGALWFTESNGNRIGRMTTDGQATEFTLTAHRSHDYYLTPGPGGALWFTGSSDGSGTNIGRIATNGVVTDYPVDPGNHDSELDAITAGPNNTLWFVENPHTGNAAIGNLQT